MIDMSFLDLLGNAPDIGVTPRFAAIIGEYPSRGARSPKLWNAVFAGHEFSARFHPFDVAPMNLAAVVEALRKDTRFIGGAVAVPYKSAIVPLLDEIDPVVGSIGAVNALYRNGSRLVGTNTDGEAALTVLRRKLGVDRIQARNVLIIGSGGTGAAVASYVARDLGNSGHLFLSNRGQKAAESLAARLTPEVDVVAWPPQRSDLKTLDVLINCTSVGYAPGDNADTIVNRYLTALSSDGNVAGNIRGSLDALRALPPSCIVFDVVYQPRDTMLLCLAEGLGLPTLSGLSVNLEQAVIAFAKAVPDIASESIRNIMAGVS